VTAAGAVSPLALPAGTTAGTIAAGPDGAVYFTRAGGHTLWRGASTLTPIDLRFVERIEFDGSRPKTSVSGNGGAPGIAAGPAGTLWIAASLTKAGGSTGGIAVVNLKGRCVVPDLRSDFLPEAKLDLANHDCRLGRVRKASKLPVSDLNVVCQSPRAGAVRRHGARVAIR
jgi:hypothetical protein